MKKINTKKVVTNFMGVELKNEEGKPFTYGEAISAVLLNAKEGGKMKMFVLGQKFYTEEEVELDEADLSLIKRSLESSEVVSTLVIGQILVYLEKIEEASDKK